MLEDAVFEYCSIQQKIYYPGCQFEQNYLKIKEIRN